MTTDLYPPYDYLIQVMQHCPRAGLAYLLLWKDKNSDFCVSYEKQKITDEYYIPWKKFKTDLAYLQKEKVIKFAVDVENSNVIVILNKTPPHNDQKVA